MGLLHPAEESRRAHAVVPLWQLGLILYGLCVLLLVYVVNNLDFVTIVRGDNFGHIFAVANDAGRLEDVRLDQVEDRLYDEGSTLRSLLDHQLTAKEISRLSGAAQKKYARIKEDPERALRYGGSGNVSLVQSEYRVRFGSTWTNACKYFGPYADNSLPSVLRLMEMHIGAQLAIRTAILLNILTRWLVAYLRTNTIHSCSRNSKFLKVLSLFGPKIQAIELVAAFYVSDLHQDQDRLLKPIIPYALAAFGIFSTLNMLFNAVADVLDKSTNHAGWSRSQFRLILAAVSGFALPLYLTAHLQYLELKECWIQVPERVAIAEYAAVLANALFAGTQLLDLLRYQILLSCESDDVVLQVDQSLIEVYQPAHSELTVCPLTGKWKYVARIDSGFPWTKTIGAV